MMSFTSWRRWLDSKSMPPQGQRPIRRRQAAGSWEECEARTLLSVTIGDVTMIEPASGTADAVFTVRLDRAHGGEAVQVDFSTEDASARAGADYVAASGTLTFAPGETAKTVAVPVIGGLATKPNTMFTVNLSNAVNETVDPSLGVAIGTILPTPWLSIDDAGATQGTSGTTDAVFKVTLDPANPDQVVTV